MVLILSSDEVRGLVSLADAIEVTETIVREEVAGTTVHMAPCGGQHARPRGLPPASSAEGRGGPGVLRVVGGGAYGLGRVGVRAGGVGDIALANLAYERAKALGRGTELQV